MGIKTPWNRDRPRSDPTVVGAVARFALGGLIALAVVGVISFFVTKDIGRSEALKHAREVTRIVGRGIVEPHLTRGLIRGDPEALAGFDRIVRRRVLQDPIVRVKLWTQSGRLAYSDEPRLIGRRYPLGSDEVASLRTGEVASDISDLSLPENRYERGHGDLLEVYLPVNGPRGEPLLFEAYQRFSTVAASGREIWLAFAPALLVALVVLELAQLPLASSMANRIRRGSRDREALLQRAVDASDAERRRIAADIHDGIVQDLAGLSYSLAAAAERTGSGQETAPAETLRRGAEAARQSVRELRSLLVEIYPPSLQRGGLEAALSDLLAPLEGRGIRTDLELPDRLEIAPEKEALLFRTAQEAIRNAVDHAEARQVEVRVRSEPSTVSLLIADDGKGFVPGRPARGPAEGHLGLSLLRDLADDARGKLEIDSAPGAGTRVHLEVGPS